MRSTWHEAGHGHGPHLDFTKNDRLVYRDHPNHGLILRRLWWKGQHCAATDKQTQAHVATRRQTDTLKFACYPSKQPRTLLPVAVLCLKAAQNPGAIPESLLT